MRSLGLVVLVGLVSLATIVPVTPRPAWAAWPSTPFLSVPLTNVAGDQYNPVGCTDGAGGAIFAWVDYRGADANVYAQRVSSAGVPLWTANGVAVCTAPGDQGHLLSVPQLSVVSDGAGGAFIAWEDRRNSGTTGIDVYIQRVSAAGTPLWTANGVAVTVATGNQYTPALAPAPSGGCFVAWYNSSGSGSIVAQRFAADGTPLGTAGGVTLLTGNISTSLLDLGGIAPDAAGGFFIVYSDFASFSYPEIWLAHANTSLGTTWSTLLRSESASGGSISFDDVAADGQGGVLVAYDHYSGSLFTPNSLELSRYDVNGSQVFRVQQVATVVSAVYQQEHGWIVPDGYGGAFLAWQDTRNTSTSGIDIYGQYVAANGVLLWGSAGKAISADPADQTYPRGCTDGANGAIFVWEDRRNGNSDVYSVRVTRPGVWGGNPLPIGFLAADQYQPWPVDDGFSGIVCAWGDSRGGSYEIDAQRMDRTGWVGDPNPAMAGVRDVPNDQGGQVKVQWTRCYLDAAPDYSIASYDVWRSVPPLAAQAAIARGATLARSDTDRFSAAARGAGRTIEPATTAAGAVIYWEYVGTQVANGDPAYSYVAPTTSDSLGGSNPRTYFRVVASSGGGGLHWTSQPDSGYSVDNLPPAPPAPFQGVYAGGIAHLYWGPNHEADLANYRLYRGSSPSFVPDAGHLVSAVAGTSFDDAAGLPQVYKLTAVDAHGNESAAVTLLPLGATGVEDAAPAELALAAPSPNPASRDCTLRYALPVAGVARVAVYDAQGRLVCTLADGAQSAGAHMTRWDLRDDAGRPVSAGLYFARLETAAGTRIQRLAVTR